MVTQSVDDVDNDKKLFETVLGWWKLLPHRWDYNPKHEERNIKKICQLILEGAVDIEVLSKVKEEVCAKHAQGPQWAYGGLTIVKRLETGKWSVVHPHNKSQDEDRGRDQSLNELRLKTKMIASFLLKHCRNDNTLSFLDAVFDGDQDLLNFLQEKR